MKTRQYGRFKKGSGEGEHEAAEALAIAALSYLASEPEQFDRFLSLTGIGPGDVREAAREPHFLAGVLEHISSDEHLLVAFATHAEVKPTAIERARMALGGVWERDIP